MILNRRFNPFHRNLWGKKKEAFCSINFSKQNISTLISTNGGGSY